MASEAVPEELERLVQKMHDAYTQSEVEIALALAEAGEALTTEELAESTGYTDRTIRKRVRTLEERLRGEPLINRDDDDNPYLHPELASALLVVEPE